MKKNWIEIATESAKSLIGITCNLSNKSYWSIDHDDEYGEMVYMLWSSSRQSTWGTSIFLCLSYDKKEIYVMADDFQPWGNGSELPIILKKFNTSELSLASQYAEKSLAENLAEFFPQLIEDESTGRYKIEYL